MAGGGRCWAEVGAHARWVPMPPSPAGAQLAAGCAAWGGDAPTQRPVLGTGARRAGRRLGLGAVCHLVPVNSRRVAVLQTQAPPHVRLGTMPAFGNGGGGDAGAARRR